MIELEGEIKKWGNSVGLRLRKSELRKNNMRLNQKVRALIIPVKRVKVKDLMGALKSKRFTAEVMKEIDKELDIDW